MSAKTLSTLTRRLAERLGDRTSDHPAAQILGKLEQLENKATALDRMRATRNPLDTAAAHARKVGQAAKRLRAEAQKTNEAINALFSTATAATAQAIDEKAGLVDGPYYAEIRATFRSMSLAERNDILAAALKDGNSEVISATCRQPRFLTGINEDSASRYVEEIRQQKAPELLAEFGLLSEALSTADAVAQVTEKMFSDNYSADEQARIDAAEREAKAAEEALAGL